MSSHLRPGAAAGQDACDARDWTPRGGARCVCGASVDREAARVHGVDGVVPACPNCWSSADTERDIRFVTVSAAVRAFQDSRRVNARKADAEIDADAHPEVEG
jgi:hypothetical protein